MITRNEAKAAWEIMAFYITREQAELNGGEVEWDMANEIVCDYDAQTPIVRV